MTTYPVHTPIASIQHFDRSTKVWFECMNHEGSRWYSKQPSCSMWFAQPTNCDPFGNPRVDCDCKSDQMWTTEEYDDGCIPEEQIILFALGERYLEVLDQIHA